jgi:hypothetical protein
MLERGTDETRGRLVQIVDGPDDVPGQHALAQGSLPARGPDKRRLPNPSGAGYAQA